MHTIIVKRMYLYNGASREKKFEVERDKLIYRGRALKLRQNARLKITAVMENRIQSVLPLLRTYAGSLPLVSRVHMHTCLVSIARIAC